MRNFLSWLPTAPVVRPKRKRLKRDDRPISHAHTTITCITYGILFAAGGLWLAVSVGGIGVGIGVFLTIIGGLMITGGILDGRKFPDRAPYNWLPHRKMAHAHNHDTGHPRHVDGALANSTIGESQGTNRRDMSAIELFENAMDWLREHYGEYRFFAQRDIVWTVQKHILAMIEGSQLPYRVFNNHTISKGILADIVILSGDSVEVAAKFKYEPSHSRSTERGGDIWPTKLDPSVVFWTGAGSVAKDVQRTREYVEQGKVKAAYSVFIDEGGEFSHRNPHPGSEWRDWGEGRWALWSQTTGRWLELERYRTGRGP